MELVDDGAFAMTASLRYRRPRTSRRRPTPATSTASSARCCSGCRRPQGQDRDQEGNGRGRGALETEEKGDDKGAKEAADRLLVELDKIAENTADLAGSGRSKRNGAALAEVIARLPMPQGNADVKMRFTDLPMQLRDLVEDLMGRLAAAVDQDTYDEVAGPMKTYISGADYMHSDEIQSHLAQDHAVLDLKHAQNVVVACVPGDKTIL